MRHPLFISLVLASGVAWADTPHSGADGVHLFDPAAPDPRGGLSLEWDNARPEQRQALDHFYRSLQSHRLQDPNMYNDRVESLQQLRSMSSEQRTRMFKNFVKEQARQP
ncbi:hypothetical protein [Bacterioplanes sanyensis]|uniref:hypothetical protein n=1 Tax=Bacterioplanes sanyensis TaxID=1249553 RepID=UPI0012FD5D32|nr:hypothetical protein [Bacterioplanes sanyensis]